jgi:hypothetical protein
MSALIGREKAMNVSILKMVVVIVGILGLFSVGGIIALAATGQSVPDVLQNIAVGGLTGLLGLLAPSKEVSRPTKQGGA